MHTTNPEHWQHAHQFEPVRSQSERRTIMVVALTLVTMVIELIAGYLSGSIALLADGWHMSTHAAALGISVFAYRYTRKHATDENYSFGTGKVGVLGGFASAVGLAIIALYMAIEAVMRFVEPVTIHFNQAIAVATIGLAVNLLSALLLKDHDHHDHHVHYERHGHHAEHEHHTHHNLHDAQEHPEISHSRAVSETTDGSTHAHTDHNMKAAYLHVLADALTSVLAIGALSAGKWLGWNWLDPVVAIVGTIVILRWSYGLLRETGGILLDRVPDHQLNEAIRQRIEDDSNDCVVDLHLWRVGSTGHALILSIVTDESREPADYKRMLAGFPELVHVSVEVQSCETPVAGRMSRVG
ncbi:MAG: CDF family Co(II)/Ni(II) efflux transporter DmeF [Leptospiraceae bacterium]|nr:CDF family Co(II)/Ni(II) efflux transporter DmeF [Leptospiraceae bacterium]